MALGPTIRAAEAAEHVYAFQEAQRLWARAGALASAAPDAADGSGSPATSSSSVAPMRPCSPARTARPSSSARRRSPWSTRRTIRLAPASSTTGCAGTAGRPAIGGRPPSRSRRPSGLIPADPPSVSRARALAQHAGIRLYAGDYEGAAADAREAIDVARAADGPGEEGLALGVLGWCLAVLGDPEAGMARFREGQAIAERLGSVEGIALAAFNLASLLDRVGRSEASLAAAAAGYATTERLGVSRTYGGLLLGFRAKAEFSLGRWDEAEASTALGLRRGAADRAEIWLATNRARVLTARGAFDEARRLLRRAREVDDRLGGTEFRSPLLTAEAELATWEGRLADVRAIAAEGIELAEKPGPPDPSLAWLAATVLRAEADAAAAVGPHATAADRDARAAVIARIDRAAEVAAATTRELLQGSRRGRALLGLIMAERARLTGSEDPRSWAAVAAGWTEAGRPYPAAYADYRAAAAILAAGGSRKDASTALVAAAAIARELRAAPLLGLIERLARQARIDLGTPDAAGARVAPDDGPGATVAALGLTQREAEVLRLVAGGWTNQQIGDALFITRKTASVHVSNILGKLGVDHRTEAAAVAHRLGLAADPPPPPRPPASRDRSAPARTPAGTARPDSMRRTAPARRPSRATLRPPLEAGPVRPAYRSREAGKEARWLRQLHRRRTSPRPATGRHRHSSEPRSGPAHAS